MKLSSLNSEKIISHIDKIKYEIDKTLKEKYGIDVEQIEANEQSTDGNVYIAYCNNDKYVIKIYNSEEHTKSMIELHKSLEKIKLNTPRIIITLKGREYEKILNTNYLVLYSFLKGKQIAYNAETGKLDDDIVISIAKALKKIHKNTAQNKFNLPELPFKNNGKRKSMLHFDLTRNNIFKLNNGQIGFIDFDDAKYGDSVCDIAILIANLFFSKTHGVDREGMQKFIKEYYGDELDLKEKEVPLIKEYALCWINYILNGNEFDTSTTESFEVRKKLINDNL